MASGRGLGASWRGAGTWSRREGRPILGGVIDPAKPDTEREAHWPTRAVRRRPKPGRDQAVDIADGRSERPAERRASVRHNAYIGRETCGYYGYSRGIRGRNSVPEIDVY